MDNTFYIIFERLLTINFLRYFIISGIAFLVYYVLFKKKWQYKRIQEKFPKNKDYYREIFYSITTVFIFVGIGMIVFASPLKVYNTVYQNFDDYSWGYWFLSIIIMIVMHDTYFYWTHRAMHHPTLFKYFHLVHHKSTNPSPWASYAFHPLEGVVEAGVIFPIAFLIPFHPTALMVFLLFMMSYNVYGHLGYELYPKNFHKHPIGRWVNTSVNHNMHHKHFHGNYGLYFLCWDRWMGTVHKDYDITYEAVDAKREQPMKSIASKI